MARALLLAVIVASGACRVVEVFPCERDEQCASATDPGRCEPTGFCSFTDTSCASDRRYDELAGDGLAGTCVADGGVVPMCPAGYAQLIAGRPQLYRVVTTPAAWADAQADCADDGAGTHLAVVDDAAEQQGLAVLDLDIWLGYTDQISEGTFRWVNGASSSFTAWAANQPDDSGGGEDCTQQQRAPSKWFDLSCAVALAYVCECDGIPSDPSTY